jgi:hypothetical protein
MNRLHSSLLSAAVTGLFLGGVTTSCAGTGTQQSQTDTAGKHACANQNSCQGKGGCKSGDQGCKGKNTCKSKGGCATVDHHACKSKNTCKGLGGCKTGDNGCAFKNSCDGKGGCAVPVKKM